jgi:hypothetical protein
VKFYAELFSLSFQLGTSTSQMINDPNTVLFIVFNGADSVGVERRMPLTINRSQGNTDMRICGHQVFASGATRRN